MVRQGAAALALTAGLVAAGAASAATLVNFSLLGGTTQLAVGSFTFDDSKSGILDYSDLTSFSYTIGTGAAYDLAFVTTGAFSPYYYFGYDTVSQGFVRGSLDGGTYQALLTAISADFASGFFAGTSSFVTNSYQDYATNQRGFFTSVEVTSSQIPGGVPEPTTWGLMILGLGGAGVALRRRRLAAA